MKALLQTMLFAVLVVSSAIAIQATGRTVEASLPVVPVVATADLKIDSTQARYQPDLGLLTFEQVVDGSAGRTVPAAAGQLDGAPVLGYVFPTTLQAEDVGFGAIDGIVTLAITSHPDFDDTPLWDENGDRQYDNDGAVFHAHWVVLNKDDRTPGGLAVKEFKPGDASVVLPPTNPGMPMYMDSPGFSVVTRGNTLSVSIPVDRIGGKTIFNYDAVVAYMQVNTSDKNRPLLGVYEVYSVASGDLSLPYTVR